MSFNPDLTPLERLLRQPPDGTPINPRHKQELRERLLRESHPTQSRRGHLTGYLALIPILALGFYWILQSNKPSVGTLYSLLNPEQREVLYSQTWINTQNHSWIVRLDDQSQITVQPFSRFQILSHTTNRRDEATRIYLQTGSAKFSIPQQQDHPFFVQTPDATIRVTGTKFTVDVKTILESSVF